MIPIPCGHETFADSCPICQKWKTDDRYQSVWTYPGKRKGDAAIVRPPCEYLNEENTLNRHDCNCQGKWVYECELLGSCTRAQSLDGVTCCETCNYHTPRGTEPRKLIPLILVNKLSPGDVTVMEAAIHSLHAAYPGQYLTGVETTCDAVYEGNTLVVPTSNEYLKDANKIDMHYPAIQDSDRIPIHFLHAYCQYLEKALRVPVPLACNRPHVYLKYDEKKWMNQVQEKTGLKTRFALVNAGHKDCFTAKQWGQYQEVVDRLRGKVVFVQVGSLEDGHHHPALSGVIDLRGQTDDRQLIRLAWHSDLGLGPTTWLQHLYAALGKPYICLLGGREPISWTNYPQQTTFGTVGRLECCETRACWKSRTIPLGDKAPGDFSLCEQPVPHGDGYIPRCMSLIHPKVVADAVASYYDGGRIKI